MFANDTTILTDDDAIGIGMNLDRPPHRASGYGVFVVVEAYQARLGDRRRHRVESVEVAGIRDELRPFGLEHLPDCLLRQLRMAVYLRIGDAFVEQPVVQLIERFEPQARREEALADQPNLVLDLSLLPTRRRRTSHRINQVMTAHL